MSFDKDRDAGGETSQTSQSQSQSQNQAFAQGPWDVQVPYLQQAYAKAGRYLGRNGYNYYPGDAVADLTPYQTAAIDEMYRMGEGGEYSNEILRVLRGEYLDPSTNPYIDAVYAKMSDQVSTDVNSVFSEAGRTGSGAHVATLTEGLGGIANQLYYGDYRRERADMGEALGLGPEAVYGDVMAMLQAGGYGQAQRQAEIDAKINRYMYNRDAVPRTLNNMFNWLSPAYGSSGTSSGTSSSTSTGTATGATTKSTSPILSAGGGALAGYQAAGPVGAVAGGLLGLFG